MRGLAPVQWRGLAPVWWGCIWDLWQDRMILMLWLIVVIIETSALAAQIDNGAAFCVTAALDWNESKLLKFPQCSEVIVKFYIIWFTKLLCWPLVFIQLIVKNSIESSTQIPYISWIIIIFSFSCLLRHVTMF